LSGVNVAVLGAGGTIAPAIVRDLAESEEIASLLLLDLDASRASSVAERHGGRKARAAGVDARSGLAEALDGSDVLVNSASYRINLDAMRACLAAGSHYLDLGGLYWMTRRQLELDGEFRDAGLLAVLGIGSSPGKTNVMAREAVRRLGETPVRVDVVAGGRDLDPPDGFSVPYALRTLIDELTMPPVVVSDGEARELKPLASGGTVRLPEPLGEVETIHTLHSEVLTFPVSFGCRASSFRLSLAPALLERLRELVGAPEEEVERAAASALAPSSRTVSVHAVEAEAEGGRTVRATGITRPMEAWGLGGGVVSTAAPAVTVVRLLARDRIDARGVLPPERCVRPDELFPQLERRGSEITIEEAVGA
jgi:lysine 6-dehydrogenase